MPGIRRTAITVEGTFDGIRVAEKIAPCPYCGYRSTWENCTQDAWDNCYSVDQCIGCKHACQWCPKCKNTF